MAATRLSEAQKSELVDRFRAGATSAELAQAFGCSPNTVSRAVRAALEPAEYERLKRQRSRGGSAAAAPSSRGNGAAPASPVAGSQAAVAAPQPGSPAPPPRAVGETGQAVEEDGEGIDPDDDDGRPSRTLAIDDADDFSADDEEEDLFDEEESGEEETVTEDLDPFRPIPLAAAVEERAAITPMPLQGARLPASAYMLVDKTVELQPRPLKDLPEMAALPHEEGDRQALTVYLNPRQAKRQCGRSQRVIKLPDLRVLERTAPYLLSQGISRVVIEGSLYSLPGS